MDTVVSSRLLKHLGTAIPEGPILALSCRDDDHDVLRPDTGSIGKTLDDAAIEGLLHIGRARLTDRNVKEHVVVRARAGEIIAVEDQLARLHLMDDVKLVRSRHVEGLDHRLMKTVRESVQIVLRLAATKGDTGEGHDRLLSWSGFELD